MPAPRPFPPVANYFDTPKTIGKDITIMDQALQGRDYTVNTHDTTGITVTIRSNVTSDMISPSKLGSGPDKVIDSGSGNVRLDLGDGNDTFTQQSTATGKVYDLIGGAGDDQFSFAGADVNLGYTFNASNQSSDGHDVVTGFETSHDTLTLTGITLAEFNASFAAADTAAGTVITDGTSDGWSVQLNGVHETLQQLSNDGVFVFA